VFPQGVGNSWNAGPCCGDAVEDKIDDVAFIDALITKVSAQVCIDPRRVFADGFSNGGAMSFRLGCGLSTRIAAIASVSGPFAFSCTPARIAPLLMIAGTKDAVFPFSDVPNEVLQWGQCDKETRAKLLSVHGDASCAQYTKCRGGDIELCTIRGGGHAWPGGQSFASFLGRTSTDLNANDAIWQFFRDHPMPR
jgi:polyhydroxybutyrate depolymerase